MKKALTAAATLLMVFRMMLCAGAAPAQTPVGPVIGAVLTGCRKTFEETKDALIANGGENINVAEGNGVKSITEDGVLFAIAKDENTFFNFIQIEGAGDGVYPNQAIQVKFKTTTNQFEIGLWGNFGVVTTMNEEQERRLCLHAPDYRISTPYEGDLRIEAGQWYHILTAVDVNGLFQGAVWKDGDKANPAYTNQALGESFNERNYKKQCWEPSIQIQGEATFTIESYEYYTFEGFAAEGVMVETEN